ncbi:MAG TPA: hypothetical protein VME67_23965 [Mycobacterium sp.]|nr:hypothetical protein [Mycobacterium sp.]HTX97615.1 hypothetical protein [Mycobacterium sp.]
MAGDGIYGIGAIQRQLAVVARNRPIVRMLESLPTRSWPPGGTAVGPALDVGMWGKLNLGVELCVVVLTNSATRLMIVGKKTPAMTRINQV